MIDLQHIVPRVPWVSALLTPVPLGRQDSVSVVLAVLLSLVLDEGQHYLMSLEVWRSTSAIATTAGPSSEFGEDGS